jgi:hypothetical protein
MLQQIITCAYLIHPMTKILYYLLTSCFVFSCTFLKGQIETDVSFQSAMNTIFLNVEKNRVPFGILRDYAMEFTNLENFNGTAVLADSNFTDAAIFWDVYNTLLTGRIYTSATGLLRPDTIDNRWFRFRVPGQITLSGLYFNYSRYKDNAAGNFVTITGNQIYDKYVSSVWQNPYQTEEAFVISPSVTKYTGPSFNVILPTSIWLTNVSAMVSSLSINVNDGLGYRTLTPGVAMAVNYSSSGTKEWLYRLTLVGGALRYGHSRIIIAPIGY